MRHSNGLGQGFLHAQQAVVSAAAEHERQAEAVFLQLITQSDRATDVPHAVVGILFAEVIVEETGERLSRRGRSILAVNVIAGG